jgi:hypothetical protein
MVRKKTNKSLFGSFSSEKELPDFARKIGLPRVAAAKAWIACWLTRRKGW